MTELGKTLVEMLGEAAGILLPIVAVAVFAARHELARRLRAAWRALLDVPASTDARRMAAEARRGDLYGVPE